jgi:hypothetical protein
MINLKRNYTLSGSDGNRSLVSNLNPGYSKVTATASVASRKHTVEAVDNTQVGFRNSIGQTQTSSNVARATLENIFVEDPRIKRKIFRDMYYHDPVCGGAVDVYANLPFSDFHLAGTKDTDILEKFHESLSNLHLRSLLPGISTDYLVLGTFIGNSVFNEKDKIISAVMPQNIDDSSIINVPIYGVDPLVDLIMPKDLSKIMSSGDPRLEQILAHIPKEFIENIKQGRIPLSPNNTIYIPRRTMTAEPYGVSFFERVLPVHLIEKALMRGTIDVAQRRQRSVLHIMVGGDDEWVPTQSDLEAFRDLFLQADIDPTGAVITTRTGINTNEIRGATEFWSAMQDFEYFSAQKYRSFGLSEGILTGEISLSTLDASLSVMLDNIRNFRSRMTIALFYEKLFPVISAANDFRSTERYQVTGSDIEDGRFFTVDYDKGSPNRKMVFADDQVVDTKDLIIPKIVYHKHLSPEGDQAWLQMLNDMSGMGVPVPISMLAAAGGLDINEIMTTEKEDLAMRKKIASYQEKIMELSQQMQQGQDDGSGSGGGQQGYQATSSLASTMSRHGVGKRIGLGERDWDGTPDVGSFDENGRKRNISQKGKKVLKERVIKKASAVLAEKARVNNAQIKAASELDKIFFGHNFKPEAP